MRSKALRAVARVNPGDLFRRIAERSVRRATAVVWVVAALSVVSVLLALRLDPSAATSTLYDRSSPASKATERLHREFGHEPIVVLVQARREGCPGGRNCRLTDLLLTPDLIRVLTFEGCVSGNIPRGAKAPAPVCAKFAESKPFRVVNGPGTFINESARQISARIRRQQGGTAAEAERAAEAARRVAAAKGLSKAEQRRLAQQARQLAQLNALEPALRYGLSSRGAGIGDPSFVHQLVFEPSISFDAPKTRFAQFFPSRTSAVVELRPRSQLSEAGRREAIELVREAAASPSLRLKSARYVVTGEPVVAQGVAAHISYALMVLLLASLLLIAGTLALVFRARKRFLPLAPAVATVALTFGLMSVLGTSLTIASIAVLPVLAGMAVGHAIHFQRTGAPPLAAAASTAIGFGVLIASPVPMVRTFGVFVALGIVLSIVLSVMLGSALLHGDVRVPRVLVRIWSALGRSAPVRLLRRGGRVLSESVPARLRLGRLAAQTRTPPPARGASRWRRVSRSPARLVASLRNVPALLKKGWGWLRGVAVRRPGRVLAIAAAVAVVGWVLGPQSDVASSLGRLAPADLREVEDLDALGREGGVERNVSVVVTAPDLTAPGVISWMVDYQMRLLARHGYTEEKPCRQADLCPAVSLVNLFGSGRTRSRAQSRALLRSLPPYFTQGVISRDRRTANISFLVRRMPLSDQKEVIGDLRRRLDPPKGVRAELGGLTVLAVDAAGDLESSGRELALFALAVVFLLLVTWGLSPLGASPRRVGTATVPLIPIAMATGWSALIAFAIGTSLNPLSAALGALVIGFGGYVAISLSTLYRDQRGAGVAPEAALTRAYEGGDVTRAFAATALAGFGALIVSDVRMLREFGSVAVVDLAIVLAGVVIVLPAALIWAERHPIRLPRSRREWAAAGRGAYAKARAGVVALGRGLRRLPGAARSLPGHARRLPGRIRRARRFRPLRRRDEAQGP